jgi:glycosyltransferase involved in cell wall biosynthesis
MSNEIKPVCVIQGPVASRSGYGDHCFAIAADIIKWDKFDVKIVPMRWGVCPNTMLDDETRPMVKEIKSRILTSNLQSQPELFIQVSIPNEFQPKGKFNIGVTAGIESTVPKAEWIEGLNRMDLNIVPSEFSKTVLEKVIYDRRDERTGAVDRLKCEKPIEVVFEGADTSVYKKTNEPAEEIDTAISSIPETFCYLFVGHWIQGDLGADRKDVGMLVKIFSEVFKNKKNAPALVLKTSGATFSKIDKAEILKKIHDIREPLNGNLPNIYLIHGELTPTELNRLYNHPKIKAHVSLTHGEGFGRPLLEATLSGKPLLTTGWSGHLDFLPAEISNLLPGSLGNIPPSACNEWLIKEGQWFNANYSVAAQKLEDIHNNYINYITNAEKLRIQNTQKFSLEEAGKVLVNILEKRLPKFEKKVEITLPKFKKITPLSS